MDSSPRINEWMEYESLSIELSETTVFHSKLIEERALKIMNSPNGIAEKPALGDSTSDLREYLVASESKVVYNVKVTKGTKVECNCKGFKFARMCSHSVAVAEKRRVLGHLIQDLSTGERSDLTFSSDRQGLGRKCGNKRRYGERRAPPTALTPQRIPNMAPMLQGLPFNEIWHNNKFVT